MDVSSSGAKGAARAVRAPRAEPYYGAGAANCGPQNRSERLLVEIDAVPGGPGFALTAGLALLGLGVVALAAWRHGRPPEPMKGPRMIPWMLILLAGATWTLVMVVHVVNLLGLTTGRP
jgi:hypothetical protein